MTFVEKKKMDLELVAVFLSIVEARRGLVCGKFNNYNPDGFDIRPDANPELLAYYNNWIRRLQKMV